VRSLCRGRQDDAEQVRLSVLREGVVLPLPVGATILRYAWIGWAIECRMLTSGVHLKQAGEGTEGHRAGIVRTSSSGYWLRAGIILPLVWYVIKGSSEHAGT
jgi:hypothetical protein